MTVTFGKQPQGKFVFKKQSKIRWRSLDSPSEQSSVFVCGSWDDNVSWGFFFVKMAGLIEYLMFFKGK